MDRPSLSDVMGSSGVRTMLAEPQTNVERAHSPGFRFEEFGSLLLLRH